MYVCVSRKMSEYINTGAAYTRRDTTCASALKNKKENINRRHQSVTGIVKRRSYTSMRI
jgi:hypothetical protein